MVFRTEDGESILYPNVCIQLSARGVTTHKTNMAISNGGFTHAVQMIERNCMAKDGEKQYQLRTVVQLYVEIENLHSTQLNNDVSR